MSQWSSGASARDASRFWRGCSGGEASPPGRLSAQSARLEGVVVDASLRCPAIADVARLDDYDSYYYDRSDGLPLPVYRVRYNDPPRTSLYVDPARGAVMRKEDHGLHSLDFPFLYYRRPLWDIVVIALSRGGLALTLTPAAPSWRRGRRNLRRILNS